MTESFRDALSLLTVFPGRAEGNEPFPARNTSDWFGVVGMVLGIIIAGLVWTARILFPAVHETLWALVCSILIVFFLAGLTRLMHWDALIDVADGWWGGYDAPRRREIASDTTVGSFGIAAALCFGFLDVALVALYVSGPSDRLPCLLISILCASRLAASLASWRIAPAKKEGLGAMVASSFRLRSFLLLLMSLGAIVVPVFFVFPISWAFGVFAALLIAMLIVPSSIAKRFGGMTGDVYGASIFLVETWGLLVCAFAAVFA